MGTHRVRTVAALLLMSAWTLAAATTASALTDVLGGHGNFENPVESNKITPFAPGTVFDGWHVSRSTVSIFRAIPPITAPPQGNQALSLVDASGPPGQPPGKVCRFIASIATHRYTVSFLAATANNNTATIVVSIGTASKGVPLPKGTLPPTFKRYSALLTAPVTKAAFCVTAVKAGASSYPSVDAVRIIDLGP